MAKRLLTVAEAAVALGRSSVTTIRWIQSGRLPAVRIGLGPRSPLFVPEAAVKAFARAMRRPAGRRQKKVNGMLP